MTLPKAKILHTNVMAEFVCQEQRDADDTFYQAEHQKAVSKYEKELKLADEYIAHEKQEHQRVAREIIKVYDAYIKDLSDELGEISFLACNHGWRSSRVEQGKKDRAKIKALIAKYLGEDNAV